MKITTENETSDESDNDDCDISRHNKFPTSITGDDESFKLSIDAIDVIMCHICVIYCVVYIIVSWYVYGITHVSCYIYMYYYNCILLLYIIIRCDTTTTTLKEFSTTIELAYQI